MSDDQHPSSAAAGAGHAKFPLRRLVPLIVVVAASAVVFAMGWHRQLSFESLVRHHEALRAFIAAHEVSAIAAYVALYIAAAALSIPVGVYLTVTGGILFGAVLGGTAAVVGATIGAICIFLIAKSAVGDYLVRRAGPLAQKLARGFRADAFSYLLFLRLVPVFPFWLVNIVPALLGMRLGPYMLATLIGIIPAAFVYAGVGASFGLLFDRGDKPDLAIIFEWRFLLPLLGLAVLALVPVLYAHLRGRNDNAHP
jgi:uncharacterized membrane protein YdjX (TVP38/TMEM64 family)